MPYSTGESRIPLLLRAVGIDPESFNRFVDWTLCEHLVAVLTKLPEVDDQFFSRVDALRAFRNLLRARTGRSWSEHDLTALFERVKQDRSRHHRDPIPYEDYLKLLWQVPWECAKCHRGPPKVSLHVDHVLPASRGGSSKRPNLQFLCAEHNLKKSNHREVTDQWLDLQ